MKPAHAFVIFSMILALTLGALPARVTALSGNRDTPPVTGLLWLRSPLPSVFPLQVKTATDRDYHLTLIDSETGQETLSAYIRGGEFFRVLVPPGSYMLRFAVGVEWHDEDALFGSETQIFELSAPLRFGTRGVAIKDGHLVDLRNLSDTKETAFTTRLSICQIVSVSLQAEPDRPYETGFNTIIAPPENMFDLPALIPRYDIRSRLCD
jgi:hypothetical protein